MSIQFLRSTFHVYLHHHVFLEKRAIERKVHQCYVLVVQHDLWWSTHNDCINAPNYGLWDQNIQRFISIHDIFTSLKHRFNQSSHVKLSCWGRGNCLAHAQILCKQKYGVALCSRMLNGLLLWLCSILERHWMDYYDD